MHAHAHTHTHVYVCVCVCARRVLKFVFLRACLCTQVPAKHEFWRMYIPCMSLCVYAYEIELFLRVVWTLVLVCMHVS